MQVVIERVSMVYRPLSGAEIIELLLEALSEESCVVICEAIEETLESEEEYYRMRRHE